jgi:hypothetical protein
LDLSGKQLAEVILGHFEFDLDDIYDSYIAVHPEELKILILGAESGESKNNLYLYDLTQHSEQLKDLAYNN